MIELQFSFLPRYWASLSPWAFPLPPWPPPAPSTPSCRTPAGPPGLPGPAAPGAAALRVYRAEGGSVWRAEAVRAPLRPGAPVSSRTAPSPPSLSGRSSVQPSTSSRATSGRGQSSPRLPAVWTAELEMSRSWCGGSVPGYRTAPGVARPASRSAWRDSARSVLTGGGSGSCDLTRNINCRK